MPIKITAILSIVKMAEAEKAAEERAMVSPNEY